MKLVILFLCTLFSCGCGEIQLREEHLNRLDNGYVVIEFDSATTVILREFEDVDKQTETIIGASVIRYQIIGNLLLGENVYSANASFAKTGADQCGFFLLDMKRHEAERRLTQQELNSLLDELGLKYPENWLWIDPELESKYQ